MSLQAADLNVISGWYAGKEFSSDWTSLHFPVWTEVLRHFRERSCDVLEIGSWEGRSAVFFLEFLPQSRLTCIDTFGGGAENHASPVESCQIPLIERRFDTNLGAYLQRIDKIKAHSVAALDRLVASGAQFDVIYVDGSHMRDDVMVDSILAWRLLRPGGVMLWDDYAGGHDKRPAERVSPAVDTFLAWHFGEYVEVHRGYQIIIRRKAAASGWVVAYDPDSGLAGAEIEQ